MQPKQPLTDAYLKSALVPEALIDRTHGAPIETGRALVFIADKLALLPQTDDLLACWHIIKLAVAASPMKLSAYPNVKSLEVIRKDE